MRTHQKAPPGSWHWTVRMLWRSSALAALLLVSLWPLAAQDEQGNVPEASAEQAGEPPAPEYSGPAVLSRAHQPMIGQGSAFATFQPFFNVSEFYDSGPNAALSGSTPNGSTGLALGFGLTGTHRWNRATLNVQYEGNYQRYSQQSTFVGMNQFLNLTAVVPLQHHLTFSFGQTAGTSRQDFATLLLQPEILATSTPVPSNEPLNTGVRFFDSRATVVYQKSPRLSFSASVGESLIREQSLVGTNSTTVSGDVNYQLTPRTTVGVDYAFDHYGFTAFGSGDFHTVSLDYSWRVTRTVDVAVQMGMAHGSARSLSVVSLDPEIAVLLGITTGVQLSDRVVNTPSYSARLVKRWHYASANLDYQKGVSPGNGLVQTSTAETVTGGFGYPVRDRWRLSVQGGWTTLSALSSTANRYSSYMADVSMSHTIRPGLEAVASFDARPFTYVGPAALNRTFYAARIGLTFSPRPLPIVLR